MCFCCNLHRHQIHLISYGMVSAFLVAMGLVFTIFAIFQKDSQIGKIWLAGPCAAVVGLVLAGKVIIDWGPAMMHAREGSLDFRIGFDDMRYSEQPNSPIAYHQWENKCNGSSMMPTYPPPGLQYSRHSPQLSPSYLPSNAAHMDNLSGSMGTIGGTLFPLPNHHRTSRASPLHSPRASLTPSTPRSSHPPNTTTSSLPIAANHPAMHKSYDSLNRSSPIPKREHDHYSGGRDKRDAAENCLIYSQYNSTHNNYSPSMDKRRISAPARHNNLHHSSTHYHNSPRGSMHSGYNQTSAVALSPAYSICSQCETSQYGTIRRNQPPFQGEAFVLNERSYLI